MSDELVRMIRKDLEFYRARCTTLEKEKMLLEAAIKRDVIKAERSYKDIIDKLAVTEGQVCTCVINLCKRLTRPVQYNEILPEFKRRFYNINPDTLTRSVRKLVEKGELSSPYPGFYYIK